MSDARNLRLLAWGDALRAARSRRVMLRRRAVVVGGLVAILTATVAFPPVPRLVWNHSASAPIGLYLVSPRARLVPGDMVVAWPPEHARALAAHRHYLPAGVPLVKRIAGAAGDTICARGTIITLNGETLAKRLFADPSGRRLPFWDGCIRLRQGSYLLLMNLRPDSFDGRYFGPTQDDDILGKATPLWLPEK